MFGYGAQEAVLAAVLTATGQPGRYEELVSADPDERAAAVLAGAPGLEPPAADLVRTLLAVDLAGRTPGGDRGAGAEGLLGYRG